MALQMTPRQREEVEIKVCVTGVQQSSLQNCVQVNDTHLSTTTVKNHTCRNNKARFQDRHEACGGEGSEILQRACESQLNMSYQSSITVSERAKQVLWLWHQQNKLYHLCIWVSCYYSWNATFSSGIRSRNQQIWWRQIRERCTLVIMNWNRMPIGDRPQDFNLFSLLKGSCGLS